MASNPNDSQLTLLMTALNTTPHWDTHAHVFASAVLPGSHYSPDEHALVMWRETAEPHGINRVVLVQPSVYPKNGS